MEGGGRLRLRDREYIVVGGYPEAREEALEPPPVIGWGGWLCKSTLLLEGAFSRAIHVYIKQNMKTVGSRPSGIQHTSILIPPSQGGENMDIKEIKRKTVSIDFYWDKQGFIVILVNNTGLNPNELADKIERMLDEYREENPDYNTSDWLAILEDVDGIEILTTISYNRDDPYIQGADYSIYF